MSVVSSRNQRRVRRLREAPRDVVRVTPIQSTPQSRRRELGPTWDSALYTCGCGFVFNAPVSTQVGCPHCGDTQAW